MVGAIRALWDRGADPDDVATAAHAVEVDCLGQQSGLQDQFAAAHGGISYIRIRDYPSAMCHRVAASDTVRGAVDRQLLLVYLGRAHDPRRFTKR